MTYYNKFFAYLFKQGLICIITIPEISRDAPLIFVVAATGQFQRRIFHFFGVYSRK